jgi:hypothetical protein
MTDYKEKYFKYKNKYSSIKNQLGGSAPVPAPVPAHARAPGGLSPSGVHPGGLSPGGLSPGGVQPIRPVDPLGSLRNIYKMDRSNKLLPDYLDLTTEKILADTNKETRDNFRRLRNGYTSEFAPDIKIILINNICQGNDNCNRYITHSRIKEILHKNGITIPADGLPVIPLLKPILLRTIPTANKIE